ncbi:MAG: ROK family protein, partial [Phycisphaerae bacterium]
DREPAHQVALAVDIGGGHVRAGFVNRHGRVEKSAIGKLPARGNPDELAALLQALRAELGNPDLPQAHHAGIAVPGIWDRTTGIMKKAVNLPALEGVNIRKLFADALESPVYIDNDVNAATWAQWHARDDRPARFVYLSIGTGIGGGVILDGQLVRHTNGGPGHLGFLIVDPNPPDTDNNDQGVPGSLSACAAGAILKSHISPDGAGVEDTALDRAAEALAIGILQIVHLYQPDELTLGGGVMDHNPRLVDLTSAAFSLRRSMLTPAAFQICGAALTTDSAGLIGIGMLAFHQ